MYVAIAVGIALVLTGVGIAGVFIYMRWERKKEEIEMRMPYIIHESEL